MTINSPLLAIPVNYISLSDNNTMKVNFNIIDNHIIEIAKRQIDLHNNFDFAGLDYNIADREIKLYWKKSGGDWVDKNEFSNLVMTHKGVTFLRVIEQDEKSTYEDESCLGEITFFPSKAREINDSIVPQIKPNDGDDIIYFFENGQIIRIHCEQIELGIKISNEISNNNFAYNNLTEEEAFWVMWYFLEGHYELTGGEFDLSDILSASQPFEFDDKGHIDGQVKGNRHIAPADSGIVWHWNEAIKKYREYGRPKPTSLKNKERGI